MGAQAECFSDYRFRQLSNRLGSACGKTRGGSGVTADHRLLQLHGGPTLERGIGGSYSGPAARDWVQPSSIKCIGSGGHVYR